MICFMLFMLLADPVAFKANPTALVMKSSRIVQLTAKQPPLEISSFQYVNDRMYILDTGLLQQAFIFNTDGSLRTLLGNPGPGPGEYRMPGGLCRSGDRIHLISAGRRYNLYDENGEFLSQRVDTHPGGIGAKIYAGAKGTAYFTCYSRNAPATIFQVNATGELLHSFSPASNEFSYYWSMLHPMASLVITDEYVMQLFIHKYEILFFDLVGKPVKTSRLASSIYQPPDYQKARELSLSPSVEKLKSFQHTHTRVNGFYALGEGFLTYLVNTRIQKDVLEFWDAQFLGRGRYEVPDGLVPVGTVASEVVLYDVEKNQLTFARF